MPSYLLYFLQEAMWKTETHFKILLGATVTWTKNVGVSDILSGLGSHATLLVKINFHLMLNS